MEIRNKIANHKTDDDDDGGGDDINLRFCRLLIVSSPPGRPVPIPK